MIPSGTAPGTDQDATTLLPATLPQNRHHIGVPGIVDGWIERPRTATGCPCPRKSMTLCTPRYLLVLATGPADSHARSTHCSRSGAML